MKRLLLVLLLFNVVLAKSQDIELVKLSTYHTGSFDKGAAEIADFDPMTNRIYFTNAESNSVVILDATDPENLSKLIEISLNDFGSNVNSLAVYDTLLAVAVQSEVTEANGRVVFYNTDGDYLIDH